MTRPAWEIADSVEERAAIVEFEAGIYREKAQRIAAEGAGFTNWNDFEKWKEANNGQHHER